MTATQTPAAEPHAELKSDLLLCTVYIHRLLRAQTRNDAESSAELSVLNTLEHWGPRLRGGAGTGSQAAALTQKELASYEQVSQAAISNTVKKLRARELVRCTKNSQDTRSVLVSLTPKGRRHLARQGPKIKRVFDGLLASLDPDQLAIVSAGQRVLSDALTKSAEVQAALQTGT